MTRETVAVLGSSGFIGTAVCESLESDGFRVVPVRAPRFSTTFRDIEDALSSSQRIRDVEALAAELSSADVVINAAGSASALSSSVPDLLGANALLPAVIQRASAKSGVRRFIHISSAGVQGRLPKLDESPRRAPLSAYTKSKSLGEQLIENGRDTVIFRPTSVHGHGRAVTQSVIRFARSKFASVAGQDRPTPQVLVQNVGSAAAFLASRELNPPEIVLQPSEGLTTGELLLRLGGRAPRRLPDSVAKAVVGGAAMVGKVTSPLAGAARRLEMVWFGQDQVPGWLSQNGWSPPVGLDAWSRLD